MKIIKTEKEKNTIILAVFFSLAAHLIAGIFLFFCLSMHSVSSTELNGIKLVWLSFDDKRKINKVDIKDNHSSQTMSFKKAIIKEQINIEMPNHNSESIPVPVITTTSSVKTPTAEINEMPGSGQTQNKSFESAEYSSQETAGNLSHESTVIAYPLYKENTPPVYPEIARVRGYEGIVLVSAEILPNGRVGEIKIRKSSGYAILDQSAIQAVKPWKFEPAKKSGNPFTAWVELPIKFILNSNSQS